MASHKIRRLEDGEPVLTAHDMEVMTREDRLLHMDDENTMQLRCPECNSKNIRMFLCIVCLHKTALCPVCGAMSSDESYHSPPKGVH